MGIFAFWCDLPKIYPTCSFNLEIDIVLTTKLLNPIIITEKQTSFPVVVQNSQVSALEHPQSPQFAI